MPNSSKRSLMRRFIGRALERRVVLVRDAASSYLELEPAAGGPMDDLLGHSVTYRVAVGPHAGQKVFSLQTVPARADESSKGVAQYAGFSLHAGLGVEADQRDKLERLARYVSRSPVSVERLTAHGQVRYRLKTPYRGRNNAHRAGAVGLHREARGARAAAASRPDAVSWRIRGARGVARGDYAGRQKGVGEASRRAAADA